MTTSSASTNNAAGGRSPDMQHRPGRESRCAGYGPPVNVVVWRQCRLMEAGFEEGLARRVAADPAMDVHALLDLVDRGCPPELAVRILAPMEPTR